MGTRSNRQDHELQHDNISSLKDTFPLGLLTGFVNYSFYIKATLQSFKAITGPVFLLVLISSMPVNVLTPDQQSVPVLVDLAYLCESHAPSDI